MKRRLLGAALAVLVGGQMLLAHHPISREYRTDERTTIEGVIVSMVVKSPHSYLHVQAPDRFKRMRVWAVECGDSRGFRRRVDERSLKPGDRVIVTGDPATDEGVWRLRLRTLVRAADGWRWNEGGR